MESSAPHQGSERRTLLAKLRDKLFGPPDDVNVIGNYLGDLYAHALFRWSVPITTVWLTRHVVFDMPTPIIRALLAAYDVHVDKAVFDVPASEATSESKHISDDAMDIVARARGLSQARGDTLRIINPADVLVSLATHPTSAAILESLGLSRLKITYFLSHGRALPATREDELEHLSERSGEAFVRINNDHFTEMDLVTRLIGEVFGFDAEESQATMLIVHRHGSTFIGPYAYFDAADKAARAIAMAREAGAPLRVSLARDNSVSLADAVAEAKHQQLSRRSARQGRPVGFIVQHWRGEQPFLRSFLILGVLGSYALGSLCASGLTKAAMHLDTPVAIAAATLIVLFAILAFTWLWTGLWRSASAYKTTKWRTRVATFAQGAMVLGAIASLAAAGWAFPSLEGFAAAFIDTRLIPRYSVTLEDRHTVVFSGGFRFGASRDLRRMLDAHPDVAIVRLESPGGLATEGLLMGELIKQYDLVTHVRGTCGSACTSAFLGGWRRYLSWGGRLVFHRSRHGVRAGARESLYSGSLSMSRSGISQSFIDRVANTPATSSWTPEHGELIEAGVVHVIGEPLIANRAK